ncbi:MAG: putative metal-dependent hydrolase [Myxococcota bacterium]
MLQSASVAGRSAVRQRMARRVQRLDGRTFKAARLFVISKLGWIRRQQRQMTEQERIPPREYLTRESHCVWGARYLLEIVEEDMPPTVTLRPKKLWLRVRPGADKAACQELLSAWYRAEVRKAARPMLDTWSRKMKVEPQGLYRGGRRH